MLRQTNCHINPDVLRTQSCPCQLDAITKGIRIKQMILSLSLLLVSSGTDLEGMNLARPSR